MLSQFYRTCCCHHGYVSLYESSIVTHVFSSSSWLASWVDFKMDVHGCWKWTIRMENERSVEKTGQFTVFGPNRFEDCSFLSLQIVHIQLPRPSTLKLDDFLGQKWTVLKTIWSRATNWTAFWTKTSGPIIFATKSSISTLLAVHLNFGPYSSCSQVTVILIWGSNFVENNWNGNFDWNC